MIENDRTLYMRDRVQYIIFGNNKMNEQFSEKEAFCMIFVRSFPDVICSLIYIAATLFILVYTCKGYNKLRWMGTVTSEVSIIYYMVIAWAIIFLFNYTTNIYYYIYVIQPQIWTQASLQSFSIMNNTLAALVGYITQGLLIELSINISKNVFDYNSMQGEIFPQALVNFYNFMKIYRWVRWIRIVQLVLFCVYAEQIEVYSDIGLYMTEGDSIVVLLCMLATYFFIIKRYMLAKSFLSKRDKSVLKREFITLIFCAAYRCFCLFFFVSLLIRDVNCPEGNTYRTLQVFALRQPQQIVPLYFIVKIQLWIQKQQTCSKICTSAQTQLIYS